MTTSEAWRDLGGIGPMPSTRRHIATVTRVTPEHVHYFDGGWCSCGTRDDGRIAEGSPAWRAARAITREARP